MQLENKFVLGFDTVLHGWSFCLFIFHPNSLKSMFHSFIFKLFGDVLAKPHRQAGHRGDEGEGYSISFTDCLSDAFDANIWPIRGWGVWVYTFIPGGYLEFVWIHALFIHYAPTISLESELRLDIATGFCKQNGDLESPSSAAQY